MVDAIDMRKEAVRKRIEGFAGGNRYIWQGQDIAKIYNHIESLRPEQINRAARPIEVKAREIDVDGPALAKMGIMLRSDIAPEDNPVCIISSQRVDLAGDTMDTANVDCTDFAKFCQVLDTHDSSKPPVALSTMPWRSGTSLLAIAKFPKPGISEDSDRIASVVRAGLQRGTSIGFVPLSWSFSKDPARPMGIDFKSIKLLEWSFCAQPCNQDCRVIGSVSGKPTSSPAMSAAMAGPTSTREQRMAEAGKFRRTAYRV